jgi:hypothetical protein
VRATRLGTPTLPAVNGIGTTLLVVATGTTLRCRKVREQSRAPAAAATIEITTVKRPIRPHVLNHGDRDVDCRSVRYIAILIAMLFVLALALVGLPTGGSSLNGPAAGSTGASTPVSAPAAQQSQGGYGSAIKAARNAVSVASQDAQSTASANP